MASVFSGQGQRLSSGSSWKAFSGDKRLFTPLVLSVIVHVALFVIVFAFFAEKPGAGVRGSRIVFVDITGAGGSGLEGAGGDSVSRKKALPMKGYKTAGLSRHHLMRDKGLRKKSMVHHIAEEPHLTVKRAKAGKKADFVRTQSRAAKSVHYARTDGVAIEEDKTISKVRTVSADTADTSFLQAQPLPLSTVAEPDIPVQANTTAYEKPVSDIGSYATDLPDSALGSGARDNGSATAGREPLAVGGTESGNGDRGRYGEGGHGQRSGTGSGYGSAVRGLSAPPYPLMSRLRGEEGAVEIMISLGPEGRLINKRLLRSSGFARLDKAALKAVNGARFMPPSRGAGSAVYKKTVVFVFRLKDSHGK